VDGGDTYVSTSTMTLIIHLERIKDIQLSILLLPYISIKSMWKVSFNCGNVFRIFTKQLSPRSLERVKDILQMERCEKFQIHQWVGLHREDRG
jgi:hypothetical protein